MDEAKEVEKNTYVQLMNIKTAGKCMFAKVKLFCVGVCLSTPV
jgi:hypothetical protein